MEGHWTVCDARTEYLLTLTMYIHYYFQQQDMRAESRNLQTKKSFSGCLSAMERKLHHCLFTQYFGFSFSVFFHQCLMNILGAFAKLRKATFTFVMSTRLSVLLSVCLSVHMEKLGSHWADFHEI